MKIKRYALLILIMTLALTACQKTDKVPKGPLENLDMNTFYTMTTGTSWLYEGSFEHQAYESLVNIEDDLEKGSKTFMIEGAVVDQSSGEAGNLNYTRQLRVSQDQIIDVTGSREMLLLKNPVQVGQTWETPYFDQQLGYYLANAEIVDFQSGLVTVRYSPKDDEPMPKGLEETLTFEVSKGITQVSKKLLLNIQQDDLTDFTYAMTKTFTSKPSGLHFKYTADHPLYALLYANPKRKYEEMENEAVHWHYVHRKDTAVALGQQYREWIKQLDATDVHSLALSRSVATRVLLDRKDGDDIVRAYFEYANRLISEQFYDLSYLYGIEPGVLDQLMVWDEETNTYALMPITDGASVELRALRPLIKDAGLILTYMEGYAYSALDGLSFINTVEAYVSETYKDYLSLLKYSYENAPLFYEGTMVVDKAEFLEHLIQLDIWASKNATLPEAFLIAEDQKWYAALFILPNYFYEDASFVGGIMSQTYIHTMESALEKHDVSTPLVALFKEAYKRLSETDYLLTKDYIQWLEGKGYNQAYTLTPQDTEAELQLNELKVIAKPFQRDTTLPSFEVSTVDELIEAIGSDRRITLKQGALLLPYYGTLETKYAMVKDGALTIQNVSNLTIEGIGESPTTVLSQSAGMAMRLQNVKGVKLVNLRIGHSLEYCTEASLMVKGSDNVALINSILFGCGDWGLHVEDSAHVTVMHSVIADCNTYAVKIINSTPVSFFNTLMTRNGKNVVFIDASGNILFDQVQIINNTGDSYTTDSTLFALKGSYDIILKDSVIEGNTIKTIAPNEGDILNFNSSVQ